MPRESQEKRLARYRDRIDASRQWRDNKGYVQTWRRMIDLYRGQQIQGEGDQAMVNMAFSVQNVVVAAVTTQYPKFTVAPNVVGQDDQAIIAEAVLNYAWKHYNFHDEFQSAVVDTCMVGHGWLKIGWRYREHGDGDPLARGTDDAGREHQAADGRDGPGCGHRPWLRKRCRPAIGPGD